MNSFKIILPVYNAEQWIGRCLDSIIDQDFTYKYKDIIIINDASIDDTAKIISNYDIPWIGNRNRRGALFNIVNGINLISHDPDDIIITIDGDDYLANDSVLSYLNSIYTNDIWLTYGSFLPESGRYEGTCQDLACTHTFDDNGKPVTNYLTTQTYRKSGVWVTSHLRTFRKWLWDKIDDNDLRNENGGYFQVAWDLAFMYPMIEMAGKHVNFIDKILYIYNDLNPNCDGTINPALQIKTAKYIQSKPIYKEL